MNNQRAQRDWHRRRRQNLPVWMLAIALLVFPMAVWAQAPARSSGWVVLPIDQYDQLRAAAYPVEPEPNAPPVDATLTRVDYDLRVSGDVASGRASLTIDVLKDGWAKVPIPSGLLIREARLNGKSVTLVPAASGKGGAQLAALLPRSGRSILLLDVVLPVTVNAGSSTISLPPVNSGVTRAVLRLGRQGLDVKVDGGLLTEKHDVAPEATWVAFGAGSSPLGFSWRRKTEDHRADQPVRLRGALWQLVSLGEDSTTFYAEANLEIVQGAANGVRFQLPDKLVINQVLGANVADWDMKPGELLVTFLDPVEHSAKFVVNGEIRLPREGQVEVPMLRLLNTERENGGVAVEVLGAGEIRDAKQQGLEEGDASDLGETIASHQSPSMLAFRARAGDAGKLRALRVDVVRYTQQAVLMANIEEARYQLLVSDDGKNLVRAQYAVRNNQRNFLKITLPAGASVWSASLAGKPIRPGQSPDGGVLLPLEKARGGEDAPPFVVDVTYLIRGAAWNEKGNATIALPAVDLPISRTGMLLYHPPLYKVTSEPGAFRTEAYMAPSSPAFSAMESAAAPGAAGSSKGALRTRGEGQATSQTQTMVDSFKSKFQNSKTAGILPVKLQFPAFGPSFFLISELTGENQTPTLQLTYQREKKRGAR